MNSKWIWVSSKFLAWIRHVDLVWQSKAGHRNLPPSKLTSCRRHLSSFHSTEATLWTETYLPPKIVLKFRIHVESQHICPKSNPKARIRFHNWNFVCFFFLHFLLLVIQPLVRYDIDTRHMLLTKYI